MIGLHLFPFSLPRKAKQWFYKNKEAISMWDKCSTAFLAKFFPLGKTNALHGKISSFQQTGMESIPEAWALCDLGASINIMPKVIFEQLQYPTLSPTMMYVQLADSSIQYPEGKIKNMLVRVKNSFVLADFVVFDMEGDIGI